LSEVTVLIEDESDTLPVTNLQGEEERSKTRSRTLPKRVEKRRDPAPESISPSQPLERGAELNLTHSLAMPHSPSCRIIKP